METYGLVSIDQGASWKQFPILDSKTQERSILLLQVWYAHHWGQYLAMGLDHPNHSRYQVLISEDGQSWSSIDQNRFHLATVSWDGRIISRGYNDSNMTTLKSLETADAVLYEYDPPSGTWAKIHDFSDFWTPENEDICFNVYADYMVAWNNTTQNVIVKELSNRIVATDRLPVPSMLRVRHDQDGLSLEATGRGLPISRVFLSQRFTGPLPELTPIWPKSGSVTNTPSQAPITADSYLTLSAVVWVKGNPGDRYLIESSAFLQGPWIVEAEKTLISTNVEPWIDPQPYYGKDRKFFRATRR
ncbi:MAG: hypothetical protein AB7O66_22975 [Limisphaerales bacterium]